MEEHPSFEYHTVKEINTESQEDRQLVEEFWCNL